jgi:hypothetical protein
MDFPFVFKLKNDALRNTTITEILRAEFRRYASDLLYDQGIDKNNSEDFQMKIVNQPEVFIIAIDETIDIPMFCDAMEDIEITLESLFSLNVDDKILKRYFPKHAVFWNTKYSIYEYFTLQTFRLLDERGKEIIQGNWIGEYNKKSQQVNFDDLFHLVKKCNIDPVLIIWERFEVNSVDIVESNVTGKQRVKYTHDQENPDKYK